jgi:lipoprotein-releasing system permease protein
MNFEIFIALKHLLKGKRQGFVSLISMISVLSVAVGVMALIVVLAVMSGFDRELKSKIVGVQPHLILEGVGGIQNPDEVRKTIQSLNLPDIVSIAAFVQGQGIIRSESAAVGTVVKGIDEQYESVDLFKKQLRQGAFGFEDAQVVDQKDRPKQVGRVLIGEELASRLQVSVGDSVTIISPAFDRNPLLALKRVRNSSFIVGGIFRLGMSDFDSSLVLVNLKQGQNLYRLENRVTGMSIRLKDVDRADELKGVIQGRFGTNFVIRSWMDLNRNFFSALKVEKSVMTILLSLIILVAGFNIASTLIMVVMEKTRDIGIMRALGATRGAIRNIFLLQSFIVGLIGVALGTGAGLLLATHLNPVSDFLEQNFGISVFPSDIYYFDKIPSEINPNDVIWIVTFALIMSLVAGFYPARRAAKLVPVEALRYE